jgi:hypothetical protein
METRKVQQGGFNTCLTLLYARRISWRVEGGAPRDSGRGIGRQEDKNPLIRTSSIIVSKDDESLDIREWGREGGSTVPLSR